MSNKFFDFDSNVFFHFKDGFFKVLDMGVVVDCLPLMLNKDGEPRFSFYWQADPIKFKCFDEDLLTFMERVNKAIMEQLSTSLDARAILSLSSMSDPLAAFDNKCSAMSCFLMFVLALRLELTLACVVVAHFTGIMGDFA